MRANHALELASTLFVLVLLFFYFPPAHASVGVEYIGHYPLNPQPLPGSVNTLVDGGRVGNSGDEPAVVSFTLNASPEFLSNFKVTFSDNNFTLTPGERRQFNATFVFDSNMPAQDRMAKITILARPANPGGTGAASFDLAVNISATVIPEFPSGAVLVLILTAFVTAFASRRIRSGRWLRRKNS
jgi:hypothetical protein